jgi:adenylate cyclase
MKPEFCRWGHSEAEHAAARQWLLEQGATPEQVEAAERDGHLTGLAAELMLERGADLSAADLAARIGVEPKLVAEAFGQFGVAVPDVDAPRFTPADLEMSEALLTSDMQELAGSDLARVVAAALDRVADAAVAVYVQGPQEGMEQAGVPLVDQAAHTAHATAKGLDLGVGLGVLFRHHMRQAIARQRVIQEGVSRREMARIAIGFVDLVGSTAIEATLDPAELGELVSRFESRAFEVTAAQGGRVVKFIGDEIMVAALTPLAGCRVVADLTTAFTADGLRPRGGLVFGEVLYRHGDYYGPVVNLASRLAEAAIPDEVLVDRSVVDGVSALAAVAGAAPGFEPAGRRLLKGIDTPIPVWSLVPTSAIDRP